MTPTGKELAKQWRLNAEARCGEKLRWTDDLVEMCLADGQREVFERCCKAMCEWCREGKPITEPLYGRSSETWHRPFPEEPFDTQVARCHAEAIRAAFPQFSKPVGEK
jgi:hypothetical protein